MLLQAVGMLPKGPFFYLKCNLIKLQNIEELKYLARYMHHVNHYIHYLPALMLPRQPPPPLLSTYYLYLCIHFILHSSLE